MILSQNDLTCILNIGHYKDDGFVFTNSFGTNILSMFQTVRFLTDDFMASGTMQLVIKIVSFTACDVDNMSYILSIDIYNLIIYIS